jgi:hypothetical protein
MVIDEGILYLKRTFPHTYPSRTEHELAASWGYCASLVSSWWACHENIKSSFARNEP